MHVYTAITEQHKGMSEGCGKGMDKAPTCFKLWKKEKYSGAGLISPEPKESIHERDGL